MLQEVEIRVVANSTVAIVTSIIKETNERSFFNMNINANTETTGTGKVGISVSGNLDTPHLDPSCNGICFVIDMENGPMLPMLLNELKFIGKPEINVVELLKDEELFDIKAMLAEIKRRKASNPAMLKPKARKKTANQGQ